MGRWEGVNIAVVRIRMAGKKRSRASKWETWLNHGRRIAELVGGGARPPPGECQKTEGSENIVHGVSPDFITRPGP